MGNYIEQNLVKNEEVIFKTNYHWITCFNVWTILFIFPLIIPIIRILTSEFAITSKRVIIKTGIISNNTFDMYISKIESIKVNQSLLGQILNYGTVTFIGTGGSRETFDNVSNPMILKNKFQELSDK